MNKLVGYICRHGESLGNNMGLFRGVLDTPLTKTGISQAHKAKDFLANKKIDHIIASPLLRAFITADIISKPHNIQVYQHRALFPWSLGVFTGLDKEANKEALELFISNPEGYSSGPTVSDCCLNHPL